MNWQSVLVLILVLCAPGIGLYRRKKKSRRCSGCCADCASCCTERKKE